MISSRGELDARNSDTSERYDSSPVKEPVSTVDEQLKRDRPQSRKLYLSQDYSSNSRPSTAIQRPAKSSWKPEVSIGSIDSSRQKVEVSKADFEIAQTLAFTRHLSWEDRDETIVRPPSRQSSAFPILLADETEDHIECEQPELGTYDIELAKPKRIFSSPELDQSQSRSNTALIGERPRVGQSIRATTASFSNRNSLHVIDISDVDTEDRPPSRQKIGAQDLFEENKSSSQALVRRKKNQSNNTPDTYGSTLLEYTHPSSAPAVRKASTSFTQKHRANGSTYQLDRNGLSTTMSSQLRHDPLADGFTELDHENDQKGGFKIHITHSIPQIQPRIAYKVKSDFPSAVSGAVKHTIQHRSNHLSVSPINVEAYGNHPSDKGKPNDFMSTSALGIHSKSSWVSDTTFRDEASSNLSEKRSSSRNVDRSAKPQVLPDQNVEEYDENFDDMLVRILFSLTNIFNCFLTNLSLYRPRTRRRMNSRTIMTTIHSISHWRVH